MSGHTPWSEIEQHKRGGTLLTQALALSETETEPTGNGPCSSFLRCPGCPSGKCLCGFSYADHLRGFGSNVQQLGRGVRRVPRA